MGKKKAAWRKAKIEDVEDTLEDNRLVNKMRRKGTSKKEEADLHELFTVDTKGSGEGLSARTRREIARAKLFPPKGPNLGLSAAEEAKIARAERQLEASKEPKAPEGPEVFDLWSGKTEAQLLKENKVDSRVRFVPQPRPTTTPKTVGEKVSSAPAVVPAHEGQSMNPLTSAYEEITCIAAAKHIERENEEEAMQRRNRPMTYELKDAFGEEAVREMDEETKVKMYRSLKCTTPEGEEGGEEQAEGSWMKAVKNKQKSQAKRNRQKARIKIETKQKQKIDQRKLEKSVGSLGSMMKELKEQEEYFKERSEYRKALKRKRKELERTQGAIGKTRRIGHGHFSEETVLVPEEDAAGKGLRGMTVKGCAIKERLSSIINRGMSTPLPEATQPEYARRKKGVAKQKRKRRIVSPLLKNNLMLS